MRSKNILTMWRELESRTKWTAIGTVAVVAASICLSFSNCSAVGNRATETEDAAAPAAISIDQNGTALIPATAKPIPYATDDTEMIMALMDVLANKECLWQAKDDPLCGMVFEKAGFAEYNGDIKTMAAIDFYTIESIPNGREGTWRVTYEDGTTADATFRFVQEADAGLLTIESSAFPTYSVYQTRSFTSRDVLQGW